MKKTVFALMVAATLGACSQTEEKTACCIAETNPVLMKWDTQFGVPPYDKVSIEDYKPAILFAMEKHSAEIDAIVKNTEAPTFENTIVAYDKAGELLGRASTMLGGITSANTTPEYQALNKELTPIRTKHYSSISLNEGLFNRIKFVYDHKADNKYDSEQIRTIDKIYNDFARNGAALDADKKKELEAINSKLSMLYLQFGENTLNETKEFKLVIDNEADLKGVPEGVKIAAAEAAEKAGESGKWLFKANRVSMTPIFQYCENREIREKLYNGYYTRGHNDNAYNQEGVIRDIANLRVQKANILGYPDFASYKLANNMANNPENCIEFLMDLWKATMDVAKKERADLQAMMNKDFPGEKLQAWDWWYYTEKVRKAKFNLDSEAIKPYFELTAVTQGAFDLATKLYGIEFTEVKGLPTLCDEVKSWDITEDGKHIGSILMDFHPRDGKRSGAWCGRFRSASYDANGKKIYPIINIVCNFTRPAGDIPALLTIDEVETLFHEFGHGLHGLFSDGSYDRISGDMPRDMIELPSQIMENWSMEPEFLKEYAKHYKTGEVIPDETISKIVKSSTFNQGFLTGEYLAAALLDMKYHAWKEVKPNIDIDKFEKETLAELGLIDEMLPRYRSGFFNHAFGGDGYSAGYYVYIWAAVLDADAFMSFVNSGDLYNQEIAAKFRKYILAGSGQGEPMDQYFKFRGEKPTVDALKTIRGLN